MDDLDQWYRNIGYNITWFRRCSGFTQEALADRVNISRSHLAAIEAPNSDRRPSMDLIFRIAHALNISPEELLKVRFTPPDTENK